MLLYLIRHGDPIYDPDSLTKLGHRQAEAVARRLSIYGIDRLYASSSTRAIMTATPTSEITKKEIEILDWCNEGHAWREMTLTKPDGGLIWGFQNPETIRLFRSEEVRRLGRKWYEHPAFKDTTFGLGIERVQKASDEFLKSLGYEHDLENNCYIPVHPTDERVAIFAHQGFGLCFLSCLLDIPYPMMSVNFDFGHSGMTVIEFAEKDGIVVPCVLTLANDSHLLRDGLPTHYQNRLYF